ncbi:MAG: 30S ribosomal protein S12 methylthiotransferase RimO [Clostridia bacterium]
MDKVGIVSLGCSKNRVDTEYLMGHLKNAGLCITADASEADIIIVNTCGFITSAKQESIDTVLEMAKFKQNGTCKLLVMCGCLSERYHDELTKEFPEVDLFWGVKDQYGLAKQIVELSGMEWTSCMTGCTNKRILTTPPYSAYLRIADGCDNNCTYCAIPLIRGRRVSIPMEKLLDEAAMLADSGVKELTVIAQDTSAYGIDIYGKPQLARLLKKLADINGLEWVRVLYTYPSTVDEDLVDTILSNDKLTNYLDMPIQHINKDVLSQMNRHGSSEHIEHIINYIRKASDEFILRSTVIVGFPGETQAQFGQLAEFVKRGMFDRLGAFTYSQEEGTPAAQMTCQIDESIKQCRYENIMQLQQKVSYDKNKNRVGRTVKLLVDRVNGSSLYGRSYAEAPEVDGYIHVKSNLGLHHAGEFITVRLTDAKNYDMWGEEI